MQMAIIFGKFEHPFRIAEEWKFLFTVDGEWENHKVVVQEEGFYLFIPFRDGYVYDPSDDSVGAIEGRKIEWLDEDEAFDILDRVFPDIYYNQDRIPVD